MRRDFRKDNRKNSNRSSERKDTRKEKGGNRDNRKNNSDNRSNFRKDVDEKGKSRSFKFNGGRKGRSDRRESRENKRERNENRKDSRKIDGIIFRNKNLYTINTAPGFRTKFDRIEKQGDSELRLIEPRRSKMASSVVKGLSNFAFKEDSSVLYLGASHGYTVSFLSDICPKGVIFCLDVAPRVMRDLVYICEERKNLVPLLGDANDVSSFNYKILPSVEIVFMDVAQKNQADIFLKNCKEFLMRDGIGYLTVKSRAVDTTMKPEDVYKMVRSKIKDSGFLKIIEEVNLHPIHKDHLMFVVQKVS